MTDMEQGEFDFRGPVGDGYALWQADWVKLQEKIAELWCLPINRRVRLQLRDVDCAFDGVLRLAARPALLDSRKPLFLKLDQMTFYSNEIEKCSVVEGEE
jgi:hypothetical protein